jgi:site-specific DNA recombinase
MEAKRAAVYVRVSSAGQAKEDKLSLPEQARELKALAEARGWQVIESDCGLDRLFREEWEKAALRGCFGDPGITGDTVDGRPGMVALLAAVKAGQVDAVLVRDTNRLARHELAAQQIHAVLEAHGVSLVTPAMEYEYANLQHRLMLGLLGSIEAYAKRWLVQNMRKHREAKKQAGKFGNAHAPYGFRWDKQMKRPVPVPEKIEVVRAIYLLSTQEGLSTEEIAERLRDRRVPTRKAGGWWYSSHIGRILRSPSYKGEWHTAEGVVAKSPPEAIVDARTWAAAQRVIEGHSVGVKCRWDTPQRPLSLRVSAAQPIMWDHSAAPSGAVSSSGVCPRGGPQYSRRPHGEIHGVERPVCRAAAAALPAAGGRSWRRCGRVGSAPR